MGLLNVHTLYAMGIDSFAAYDIVLVHGAWADGSSWSKIILILKNA